MDENMETFLKEIKSCRENLKENRKQFWAQNKKKFKKNIKRIIKISRLPKGWKIYVIASKFLTNKNILPFDQSYAWSLTDLVAATRKQGFAILIFFNKSAAEFLSLPAIVPLIIHELGHVKQIAASPKNYIKATINDKIAKDQEIDAEKNVKKLPDAFRQEFVLESILYCYDFGGWKLAERMAYFLFKEVEKLYCGGYKKEMTKREYETFLCAKQKKNINVFINSFLPPPRN